MADPSNLTLMIYLVGIFVSALILTQTLPGTVERHKRIEREAMKVAMDPDAPRGAVRRANARAGRARRRWQAYEETLEMVSTTGRSTLVLLIFGLLWPGMVVLWVWMTVADGVRAAHRAVSGVSVECDVCETEGPWGWTYRAAQKKAARQGWAILANKEDLCPGCAAAEGHAPVAESR